jgi:signal transduction histidine kinase
MSGEDQVERERLLALFEEAPTNMVVIEGPELRVTMANRRVRAKMPAVVGMTVSQLYPGDHPIVASIERVFATGVPEWVHGLPPYVPDSAHAERLLTRSFVPLRDQNGSVYGVLAVAYEVTEELRARHVQREVELRRQIELQHLSAVLEEAPVLITVLEGPELRIVMANRCVRELFPGRNMLGASFREDVPPTNSTLQAACRVYESGVPETLEVVVRDIQNLVGRCYSTTVVPIRDADGSITRVMTVSFDTTEQRRAREVLEAQARDLEAARREAVEASRAKDDFLAMLSHELRNPLAAIVLTLSAMRSQSSTTSPEVELMDRQVKHLVRMVDDLLDVSRIARGQVELALHDVELPMVVRRALEMSRPQLERRQHRILNDLAPATVRGDPDRLAQAVANLITNAAKYSEIGSEIRIRTECEGGVARISVADDGAGIAPDMLSRVFDPFVQQPLTLARSGGGLGLGLSITRSLVEAHRGTVSVRSDGVGKGSRFAIELAAIERPTGHPEGPPQTRRHQLIRAMRILVVDDNRDAAQALKTALEALGQIVMVAHDGPEALREVGAFQPQIGLLDIGLPEMDGYQLAAQLRAVPGLRLVAITGYGQTRDRQRSREVGFEEHLVKPVNIEQLTTLLGRLDAGSS